MNIFWWELVTGVIISLGLFAIWLYLKKNKKIIDDQEIIQIITQKLEKSGYEKFELKSIISMNEPNITSVIVYANHLEIGIEIDNNSRKINNFEKLAKQ